MSKNYNVILIGIDTLRADHLGVYGYERPTSPNIDALAREGMLFQNCFAQAPITAPSFMSIMTSRYPTYHGITDNFQPRSDNSVWTYTLDPDIPTLAGVLKKNGYRTGAFADGGNMYGKVGFSRGFDYYGEPRQEALRGAAVEGSSRSPVFHGPMPAKEIFLWLKEFKSENFFLFLHTYAVHSPWLAPKSYRELFCSGGGYAGIMPETDSDSYKSVEERLTVEFKKGNRKALADYIALYDGAIRYADDFVGELINKLDVLGISDNTILVFTSDHGEEFFEQYSFGHHQLYQELLHVPLIIKVPGTGKPTATPRIVRSIDIMPTVLELCNARTDFPIHGVSLLGARGEDRNLVALAEAETIGRSLQDGTIKYMHHQARLYYHRYLKRSTPPYEELYDLATDPGEKNNIAETNPRLHEKMFTAFEHELHRLSLPRPKRTKTVFEYHL